MKRNWEEWAQGKTEEEVEGECQRLMDEFKIYAPKAFGIMRKYLTRWRPDLLHQLIACLDKGIQIDTTSDLSEEERQIQNENWAAEFISLMEQVVEEAKLRGRPIA